jgi:NADH dehydrogenase
VSTVPRVVIVGAGFAGLGAARRLAGRNAEVTVIDRHNFHTFQPFLYQVATAGLAPADIAYPVRAIFGRAANITFRHGRVVSVDLDVRCVTLDDGQQMSYDHLVLATGAMAEFFGVSGAPERARPLYTLADARALRNHILGCLEAADAHPEDYDGGAPNFVVVGGGPTGVEMCGALVELLEVSIRRDRLRLDRRRSKVVLVEAGDRLLAGFSEESGRYAEETLRSRDVDVRLRVPVEEVTAEGVHLQGGEFLPAAAVIWAGGVTVDGTLAASLAAPHGRGGRVMLLPDLSIAGHPEVFVAGDAGAVPRGPASGDLCPQVAPVAIQSGGHAGRQIVRQISGRPTTSFAYRDKGLAATIGRRAAIAQLRRGPTLRGTLGWLGWLALHLVYLIGFRNRVIVLINWWWRYFDWPAGPRLIMADVESEP